MFTVKGIINGEQYRITWKDGEISGDPEAIAKAVQENRKPHGYLGLFPAATDEKY